MDIAIVLASGAGSRLKVETPKQFLKLAGKTVVEHTLDAFERHPDIDEIILVCRQEDRLMVEEIVGRAGYRKIHRIVRGGATRRESSASGVMAVTGDEHRILVHDAARPLIDAATIDRCLVALASSQAVDTAIPAGDTIIQLDGAEHIEHIPDRGKLRLGQTPQAFRSGLLKAAHRRAMNDPQPPAVTDDCGLVLHYKLAPVKVVPGDINNIKVTYPSDIYLADRLFQLRAHRLTHGLDGSALRDRVLVIFGASRGIGRRMAAIAKSHGAHVIGVSRATGVDVADGVAVKTTLRQAAETYGRVDMVANTAGILRTGSVVGQSYDAISEQISTNLLGSIVVVRESFEVMRGTGGSIALFTSSSYTRGRARSCVYSAAKAGIVNLMQGASEEGNAFGVKVNAINPERTHTPMRTENFGLEPAAELLDADQVAEATLAVLAADATGEVIDVRR